jgi:hypothetical protein
VRDRRAPKKPSKYHNVKTVIDGRTFHSKHEADVFIGLCLRERAGQIRGLRCQVAFPLLTPVTGDPDHRAVVVAAYIADFVYESLDGEHWTRHVLDAKGVRTAVYALKKRWLFLQESIDIEEI